MTHALYDIPLKRIDGNDSSLAGYRGTVLLVVNVASKCGLTPQYQGLESLYQDKRQRGFEVLGFPANNFKGQEPGSDAEISEFCSTQYDVHFPLFSKISVAGADRHPLYAQLIAARPQATGEGPFRERLKGYGIEAENPTDILWNFEKFLIGRDGEVAARFAPDVAADDPRLLAAIERELAKTRIKTRDGICPSYVYRPAGNGPWPAVLVFMDGLAIRPAMLELGERLASHGYFVLLPDLFYRSGPYEPMDPHTVFSDPEKRKILMEKYFAFATPANIMSDTRAFLDYLAAQPEVKPGAIGTTGYCMGGLMSLAAAGTYPDEIAATASYHGGRLASDADDSPHLLAPKIQSRVYIAGAIEDQSFPEEMKQRLEEALSKAGVDYKIETYNAKHGWVFRDTPVYDAAAAERHWQTLFALFDAKLK